MKIRALAVAVALAGCSQQVPSYTASSGSLALSNDDSTLYAIDTDSNQLFVIDAKTEEVKASITVGLQPEKVVVAHDETIFVSNRMGRSVSVIRKGDWKEAARLTTAVEPAGMAIDGNTLLVVNATMLDDASVGSLMAFDVTSLEMKWETPVGHEPRAVAVVGGNALVSLYKGNGAPKGTVDRGGDVVTVELKSHQVTRSQTETFANINKNALNAETGGGFAGGDTRPAPEPNGGPDKFSFTFPKQHPRGIESLTVSPDGKQVYAATLLSSDTVLPSTSNTLTDTNVGFPGGGGDGYGGGTCGAGSVASPAILTFDGEGESRADDVSGCTGQRMEGQPAQVLVSGNPTMPIQGPSASVVDPTGAFLFVVGKESNNVAILPTNSAGADDQNGVTLVKGGEPTPDGRNFDSQSSVGGFFGTGSVHTTVSVGAGPTGVALSRDGNTAWVLNSFDHSISKLQRKNGVVQQVHVTQFTSETLPANVVAGRKLFFSAVDSRMSSQQTGISCASCHLEGREDGHVWNFTDGPRQTPSLAGRLLSKTAPFHWNGEFEGLTSFMAQTVNHRMGGAGVTKPMEEQLLAFIESQPAADNPHKRAEFTDAQLRGRAIFAEAQCNTCHAGEAFTDNSFANVGTYVTGQVLNDDVNRFVNGGLNTPSLLGLARTAPYLHDGTAVTLKDRFNELNNGGAHGKKVDQVKIDDLVEYLKTL